MDVSVHRFVDSGAFQRLDIEDTGAGYFQRERWLVEQISQLV